MDTRVLLNGRLADIECQMCAFTSCRDQDHEVVIGLDLALGNVVQRLRPKGNRPMEIVDADHDGSDTQHVDSLAANGGPDRDQRRSS